MINYSVCISCILLLSAACTPAVRGESAMYFVQQAIGVNIFSFTGAGAPISGSLDENATYRLELYNAPSDTAWFADAPSTAGGYVPTSEFLSRYLNRFYLVSSPANGALSVYLPAAAPGQRARQVSVLLRVWGGELAGADGSTLRYNATVLRQGAQALQYLGQFASLPDDTRAQLPASLFLDGIAAAPLLQPAEGRLPLPQDQQQQQDQLQPPQQTASPAPSVLQLLGSSFCPPFQSKNYCEGAQTCCWSEKTSYGCCPYSYGVCCDDGTCVPKGHLC